MATGDNRMPTPLVLQPLHRKLLAADRDRPTTIAGYLRSHLITAFAGLDQVVAPWLGGAMESHAADVVVVGANPFLNTLALIAAAEAGLGAVLAPIDEADDWPYGVIDHPAFRRLVDARVGLGQALDLGGNWRDRLAEDLAHVARDDDDGADLLMARLAERLRDIARAPILRLDSGWRLAASKRRLAGEFCLFAGWQGPTLEARGCGPLQARALAAERAAIRPKLGRLLLTRDAGVQRVLFARRLVVTGLPAAPLPIDLDAAEHPVCLDGVIRLGTARRLSAATGDLIEQAVEDVFAALDWPTLDGPALDGAGPDP